MDIEFDAIGPHLNSAGERRKRVFGPFDRCSPMGVNANHELLLARH
jgi:hypothetical protein